MNSVAGDTQTPTKLVSPHLQCVATTLVPKGCLCYCRLATLGDTWRHLQGTATRTVTECPNPSLGGRLSASRASSLSCRTAIGAPLLLQHVHSSLTQRPSPHATPRDVWSWLHLAARLEVAGAEGTQTEEGHRPNRPVELPIDSMTYGRLSSPRVALVTGWKLPSYLRSDNIAKIVDTVRHALERRLPPSRMAF